MNAGNKKKIYAISLGCPKARVDLEVVLADLLINGWDYVGTPKRADLIIVNTCGFLESARDETRRTIDKLKRDFPGIPVVATGCMVEGFKKEIINTGARALAGTRDMMQAASRLNHDIGSHLADPSVRLVTTPIPSACLKVAEGCNRQCSFCIIPKLRGRQRSRTVDSLVKEAESLVSMGFRELVVVAQDLTAYGRDIGTDLTSLMRALQTVEGLKWLRMMYLHPAGVTNELLSLVADSTKILPYFDIPLQHVSGRMLRAMRRGTRVGLIRGLFNEILEKIPSAVFRTTLITGFPGETRDDFDQLINFISHQPVMLGGVFGYSPELLSSSHRLPDQVAPEIIEQRQQELTETMEKRAGELMQNFVGKRVSAVIYDRVGNTWKGRTWFQAPEGIDGELVIRGGHVKAPGFLEIRVTRVKDYTVYGRVQMPGHCHA